MSIQIKSSWFQNRLGPTKCWAVFVDGIKAHETTKAASVISFLKGLGVREDKLKEYAKELGVEY